MAKLFVQVSWHFHNWLAPRLRAKHCVIIHSRQSLMFPKTKEKKPQTLELLITFSTSLDIHSDKGIATEQNLLSKYMNSFPFFCLPWDPGTQSWQSAGSRGRKRSRRRRSACGPRRTPVLSTNGKTAAG